MADEEDSRTEHSSTGTEEQGDGLLEPIVLPTKKIARLSPGIFNDYFNKTGMFSLDPAERAEGQRKYRQHRFWDYGRIVVLGLFLGVVINDIKTLTAPAVIITIVFFIIARIYGGEWWEI